MRHFSTRAGQRPLPQLFVPVAMLIAGIAVLGNIVAVPRISAAQTPSAPLAVAASCTIPPLTLPLFGGTPPAVLLATPEAPVDASALAPVSDDTMRSVREGVAGIVACLNTGDPAQRFAVFTTGYLARTFGDPARAYLPAFEQSLDQASAAPAPQYTIASFTIEGQTADGKVAVSLGVAADGEVWKDRLLLAQVGGRWLIDAVLG